MTIRGLIGGAVGGVVGFFIAGFAGAAYGAAIGFGLGMGFGLRPDVPSPGGPQAQDLDVTACQEGLPIADLLGTSQLTGNLLQYHNNRSVAVTSQQKTGKGGGGSQTVVEGYQYYLTWAVGLCAGPADMLYTIHRGDDFVWEGELERPESGGVETIMIPGVGSVDFYFGTEDQEPNPTLEGIMGAGEQPAYRGLCYAVFKDCFIGGYNRLPVFKLVLKKQPELSFNTKNAISTFDYNPAHGIWFILARMVGLPESYLNETSFSDAANTAWNEARGVSILFSSQQEALSWIDQILQHTDGAIRYGIDGKFHLALLRSTEDPALLPVVTVDEMLDEPQLDRKSWMETWNEIKVQYPRRMIREGLCPDGCDNFSGEDFSEIAPGEERIFTIQNDDWFKTECEDLSFMSDGLEETVWAGEFYGLTNLTGGKWQFKYKASEDLCDGQDPLDPECPIICGRRLPCCGCDLAEPLEVNEDVTPEVMAQNTSVAVEILGGIGPFHWDVAGTGFFLTYPGTAGGGRSNVLNSDGSACGACAVTVIDACEQELIFYVRSTEGQWVGKEFSECSPTGWATMWQTLTYVSGNTHITIRTQRSPAAYSLNPRLDCSALQNCYPNNACGNWIAANSEGWVKMVTDFAGYMWTCCELGETQQCLWAAATSCSGSSYMYALREFYRYEWEC